MKKFGLIGKSLKHSFSKHYFQKKFDELNLDNYSYDLIEIDDLSKIKSYLLENNYIGLNVTVPYKEVIIKYLDSISDEAKAIGAINTIKISEGKLFGFNTDYFGFQSSLLNFIPHNKFKALIFGSGGASKAVAKVLADLGIPYQIVSRQNDDFLNYQNLTDDVLSSHKLLINTTPLGTFPDVDNALKLNYDLLNESHYCYDLVYNPEETLFLKKSKFEGASIKNGLEMLYLQADKAWQIWNS